MSTAVSGVLVEKTDEALLVLVNENDDAIWFNIATDIVEEDRDEAEMFDEGEDVDFNITDKCAEKHGF